MIIPATTLAVITQLAFTIAEEVPRFNLEPVCRGIAQRGGLDLEPNKSVRQDFEGCVKSEMAIRDQLVEQRPIGQIVSAKPPRADFLATRICSHAFRWREMRAR